MAARAVAGVVEAARSIAATGAGGDSGRTASATSGAPAAPATATAAVPAPTLARAPLGSSMAIWIALPARTVAPPTMRSSQASAGLGSGGRAATVSEARNARGTRAASHSFDSRRLRSTARQGPQWRTWRATERRSRAVAAPVTTRSICGSSRAHTSPEASRTSHACRLARPSRTERSTLRSEKPVIWRIRS